MGEEKETGESALHAELYHDEGHSVASEHADNTRRAQQHLKVGLVRIDRDCSPGADSPKSMVERDGNGQTQDSADAGQNVVAMEWEWVET